MYETKEKNYFESVRVELLELIPKKNREGSILEIGAGSGHTLMYARQNGYAKKVYGIELNKIENSYQDSKQFESFLIGNVEDMSLPFKKEQFDVILCGDVLEHLNNPYSLVKILKKYLKKDGVFIASLPNMRYFSIIKEIVIKGDFKYTDRGILDRTHLRFFCKKNMIDLFVQNGYKIDSVVSNISLIGNKSKLFNKLTLRIFEEFLTPQYYIVARKYK